MWLFTLQVCTYEIEFYIYLYLWIDLFFFFSLYTAREMRALCSSKGLLAGWTYHFQWWCFGIMKHDLTKRRNSEIIIYILQCLWEKRGWMDIYYFSNMANPSYMLRKFVFPLSLISSMITSFIVLFHFDKLHASCSQTDKPSRN